MRGEACFAPPLVEASGWGAAISGMAVMELPSREISPDWSQSCNALRLCYKSAWADDCTGGPAHRPSDDVTRLIYQQGDPGSKCEVTIDAARQRKGKPNAGVR